MKILLLAAAAMAVQLFLFLCLGSVILKIRGRQEYSLGRAALLGYFAWFGIFEVVCLIFEVLLLPLRTLALVMGLIAAAVILAGLFSGYRCWIQSMNSLRFRLKLHGLPAVFLVLSLLASVAFVILYFDASADLKFKARYALNCFPYYNAVICSLVRGLPVIVQARSVMSAINVIMSFLGVYELGLALFPDEEDRGRKVMSIQNRPGSYSRRRADLFVLLVFVVNLLSATIYMPGIFLYTRSYEGKALIINVVIPSVLAICVRIWRETEEDAMRNLFWMMAAAVCFSASSIMAMILSMTAILPWIAVRGRWKRLLSLLCACAPVFIWGIVYYMIQHRIFVLRTWR